MKRGATFLGLRGVKFPQACYGFAFSNRTDPIDFPDIANSETLRGGGQRNPKARPCTTALPPSRIRSRERLRKCLSNKQQSESRNCAAWKWDRLLSVHPDIVQLFSKPGETWGQTGHSPMFLDQPADAKSPTTVWHRKGMVGNVPSVPALVSRY